MVNKSPTTARSLVVSIQTFSACALAHTLLDQAKNRTGLLFKRIVKRELFQVGARLNLAFLAGLFVRGVNRGRCSGSWDGSGFADD